MCLRDGDNASRIRLRVLLQVDVKSRRASDVAMVISVDGKQKLSRKKEKMLHLFWVFYRAFWDDTHIDVLGTCGDTAGKPPEVEEKKCLSLAEAEKDSCSIIDRSRVQSLTEVYTTTSQVVRSTIPSLPR